MDSTRFLRDYWQQQPLLIPASQPFENPLEPEELAGLALEPGIEARLVREQAGDWHLDTAPLDDKSFDGDEPWTLLVQRVDHCVPDVAALRDWVSFLPNWRLDDIMVSYASNGGGVGPHYDNYDVFLLQGLGQRRWQLGQRCDSATPLRNNPHLKILAEFAESDSLLLNPGDILYVPPGLAHWGTAIGPCMTYSIGFRAPRLSDMLSRWVDGVLPTVEPERLYRDPQPFHSARPGELSDAAIGAAQNQLMELLTEPGSADWFGELVSEPHDQDVLEVEEPLPSQVVLDPASRLAWRDTGTGITVYANGLAITAGGAECVDLLVTLCGGGSVETDADPGRRELLQEIWTTGCLLDDG